MKTNIAFIAVLALLAVTATPAAAQGFKVLHVFCETQSCPDGFAPGALAADGAGNFYGATRGGGPHGGGTLFELRRRANGRYKFETLYGFCAEQNCLDGQLPGGAPVIDKAGNLYGTALAGGESGYNGVVYEWKRSSGKLKVLHNFCPSGGDCSDGAEPMAGLTYATAATGALYDGKSPLYGVAPFGGVGFQGTVFQLTPGKSGWDFQVIYAFCNGDDCAGGAVPSGPLLPDASGNLYGMTVLGGTNHKGAVFELSPSGGNWSEAVLYSFCQQADCVDALADYLLSDLADRSGYSMYHWLQGSYKFHTQVRPPRMGQEFDIDLGIYFEWSGDPEDGEYSPLELKNFVQQSLRNFAADNLDDVIEVTSPKPRCCRIRFQGDFHIDVPVYHLDTNEDERSLATQDNEWEESDPKALYLWFRDKFEAPIRARARRLIKYVKAWAGLKFENVSDRPSSVLLTVLVADAIDVLTEEELAADDEALAAVVNAIIDRLAEDMNVRNPVNADEVLSDRLSEPQFDSFLKKLASLQSICDRALDAEDVVTAASIWSEAFEHFFPAPDGEDLRKSVTASSRALSVVRIVPEIAARATAKSNSFWSAQGTSKIGPIPKDSNVEFTLVNAHMLPPGATVHWTVRNEGSEAERLNDLGHQSGEGYKKVEHSAYNGTHYMDCIVKLHGTVIGFRRIPVTIQGAPIPPRNCPRPKKTWVRAR